VLSLYGKKGITIYDFSQGYLGNCWILASLSSLAEHPERIRRMITNKDTSKEGIYQIKLWRNGYQKLITVDDKIPMSRGKREGSKFTINLEP
jgi:calpain-15